MVVFIIELSAGLIPTELFWVKNRGVLKILTERQLFGAGSSLRCGPSHAKAPSTRTLWARNSNLKKNPLLKRGQSHQIPSSI